MALFEAAFQDVGKNFSLVAQKLPNKSCPECVAFYYRWKKTRRGSAVRKPVADRRSCWGHLKIDEVFVYTRVQQHTRCTCACTHWPDQAHNCWRLAWLHNHIVWLDECSSEARRDLWMTSLQDSCVFTQCTCATGAA